MNRYLEKNPDDEERVLKEIEKHNYEIFPYNVLEEWKKEGAMGLVKKDNGIQAIYGPKADVLKSDINDALMG